jgi:GT2 family glycosyltransferase
VAARPLVVGVVTYQSAGVLPGLLDSLPAALSDVDGARLVVADNASTDGTPDLVRSRAPGATLLELGDNRGYAAGVNACAAADPDADVLVLNPDVRLRPGAVVRLRAAAAADPRLGIAVPRLVEPDGRLALSLRRRPTVLRALGEAVLGGRAARRLPALSEVVADPAAYRRPTEADWATGAAMLLTRDCLDAAGEWDESYFLYSEETDFALRAAAHGYATRLVPDAEAVHVGGESHVSPPLWSLLVANKVRLYARWHGPVRATGFWAAAAAGEAVRSVARRGADAATHRAALRLLLYRRAALVRAAPVRPADPG